MTYSDGALALHTRSPKYGKLRNGVMLKVPPALVKRSKSHIHNFQFGVIAILGLNGFVWVGKSVDKGPLDKSDDDHSISLYSNQNDASGTALHSIHHFTCS
jgi:exosome complex component RRP4